MTYEKTSREIRVQVRPFYLREQSDPRAERFVWAYEIQIENTSRTMVQLLSRHWIITDQKGEVEEVHGPGVVGKQPILMPGAKFKYSSFARLATSSGVMAGHYRMVTREGEFFDVSIPEFPLLFPVRLVTEAQVCDSAKLP